MAQKNVASDSTGYSFTESHPSKPPKELKTEIQEEQSKSNRATPITNTRPRQQSQQPRHVPVRNQFNIHGGTIGQAVIGNQGPVTFESKKSVFQRGSCDTKYTITGGNFNQATFGGTSTFNNENSTVSAGEVRQSEISPEELTKCILEKGVTVEEFSQLLEKRYTLTVIALSIPNNPELKRRMVKAMLLD